MAINSVLAVWNLWKWSDTKYALMHPQTYLVFWMPESNRKIIKTITRMETSEYEKAY